MQTESNTHKLSIFVVLYLAYTTIFGPLGLPQPYNIPRFTLHTTLITFTVCSLQFFRYLFLYSWNSIQFTSMCVSYIARPDTGLPNTSLYAFDNRYYFGWTYFRRYLFMFETNFFSGFGFGKRHLEAIYYRFEWYVTRPNEKYAKFPQFFPFTLSSVPIVEQCDLFAPYALTIASFVLRSQ